MGSTLLFPQAEVDPVRKETSASDYLDQPIQSKVERLRKASPTFRTWKIDDQLEFARQLDKKLRLRAPKKTGTLYERPRAKAESAAPAPTPAPAPTAPPTVPKEIDDWAKGLLGQAPKPAATKPSLPPTPLVPAYEPAAPGVLDSLGQAPVKKTPDIKKQLPMKLLDIEKQVPIEPEYVSPFGPGTYGLATMGEAITTRHDDIGKGARKAIADYLREGRLIPDKYFEVIKEKLAVDPAMAQLLSKGKPPSVRREKTPFAATRMPFARGSEREEVSPTTPETLARAAMDTLNQWYSPAMLALVGFGKAGALPETAFVKTRGVAGEAMREAIKQLRRAEGLYRAGDRTGAEAALKAYEDIRRAAPEIAKDLEKLRQFVAWVRAINVAMGTGFTASFGAQAVKDIHEGKYTEAAADLLGAVGSAIFAGVGAGRLWMDRGMKFKPPDMPEVAPVRPEMPAPGAAARPEPPAAPPAGLPGAPQPAPAPVARPEAERPSPVTPTPTPIEAVVPAGRPHLDNAAGSPEPGVKWSDYLVKSADLVDSKEGVDHYKAGEKHYIVMPSGDVFIRSGAAGDKEFEKATRRARKVAEGKEALPPGGPKAPEGWAFATLKDYGIDEAKRRLKDLEKTSPGREYKLSEPRKDERGRTFYYILEKKPTGAPEPTAKPEEGLDYKALVESAAPGIEFKGIDESGIWYHDTQTGSTGVLRNVDEFSPDDLRKHVEDKRKEFEEGKKPKPFAGQERRLDKTLRMEVEQHMKLSGETDRAAALADVLEARGEAAKPAVSKPAAGETLPREWAESVAEAVESRKEAKGLFPKYEDLIDKALAVVKENPDFSEADIVTAAKRLIEEAKGVGRPALPPTASVAALTPEAIPAAYDLRPSKEDVQDAIENIKTPRPGTKKYTSLVETLTKDATEAIEILAARVEGYEDIRKNGVAALPNYYEQWQIDEALDEAREEFPGKTDDEIVRDSFLQAIGDEVQGYRRQLEVTVGKLRELKEPVPEGAYEQLGKYEPESMPTGQMPLIPAAEAAPAPVPTAAPSADLHKPEYMAPGTAVVWRKRGAKPTTAFVRKYDRDLREVTIRDAAGKVHPVGASEVLPVYLLPKAEFLAIPGTTEAAHERAVTLAVRSGQPVPDNVLASYPELKAKEPAPIPAPPPAAPAPIKAAAPLPRKDRLTAIREHYMPGNVVWDNYWRKYDKVLNFKEDVPYKGDFQVTVVTSDKEGNPLLGEEPRTHSTPPGKGDRIEKKVEEKLFKYSSTQVNLDPGWQDRIKRFAGATIAPEDLAGKGMEVEPHITVRWGLHTEDAGIVRKAIGTEAPIRVTFGKTGIFPPSESSDGNEVVYLEVNSPDLEALNAKLGKLPSTETHEYKPHVTLAYVKPGTGQKYAGKIDFEGMTTRIGTVTFADRTGAQTDIELKGERPPVSWGTGVRTGRETEFSTSSQRFATKEEAETAGNELMSRWFAVTETKAVPDDTTPPNYRFNSETYRGEPLDAKAAPEPASLKEITMSPEKAAALEKLKRALSKAPKPTEPGEASKMAFDPEVIMAAEEYGEILWKEGLTEYDAWAARMIGDLGDYGESAKPYLADTFDSLQAKYGEEAPEAKAPIEPTGEVGKQERVKKLTTHFNNLISRGTILTVWKDVKAEAIKAVGGDPEEYIDDLYDAIEGAFNIQRVRIARENPDRGFLGKLSAAETLEGTLPKRIRSIEITKLQQFSTPFTLSEGVEYAGDIKPGDVVREPTGGTGNLVAPLLAKPDVTVRVTELDPRRSVVLESVGFPDVTTGDYIQSEGHKADVTLMNPPWGAASTGKYAHINIPSPWGPPFHDISERFFVKALRETNPGGRVSSLMPTTILKAAGFLKWLRENHTIRALVQSPPNAYIKRGTMVDSVLLVVDKGKVAEAPPLVAIPPIIKTLANAPQTWDAWAETLKPLGEGGTHDRVKTSEVGAPLGAAGVSGVRPGAVPSGPPGGGATGQPVGGVGAGVISRPEEPRPTPLAPEPIERPAVESIGEVRLVRRTPEGLLRLTADLAPDRRKEFEDAQASDIFVPYVPRQEYGNAPSAQLHPRQSIETRSLAGVPYPELKLDLGPTITEALNEGRISIEQADAIAAQVQANQRGHSMLIAYDVGTGKSRIALGTLIEMMERGMAGPQKKVLYISAGEVNLRDVEIELKIMLGVDVDTGKLPYQVIFLRDYPSSKEYEGKDRPWEPLPSVQNTFYMVEAHNLVPYSKAIKESGFGAVVADEVHKLRNVEGSNRGMKWKELADYWMSQNTPIGLFTATPAQSIDDIEYLYPLKEWTVDGFQDFVDRVKGRLTVEQVKERQEKVQRERRADRKAINYVQSLETPKHSEFAGLYWRGLLGNLPSNDFMRFRALQADFPSSLLEPLDRIYEEGYKRKASLKTATTGAPGEEAVHLGRPRQVRERGDVFARDVSTAELEQIMRELKMLGKYASVDIWRGGLEFEEFLNELTPQEERDWTTAVSFIRDCLNAYEKFKGLSGRQTAGIVNSMAQFAIKRYLANIRMKRAIPLAKKMLASGYQVILATEFVSETDPTRGHVGAIIGQINTNLAIKDPATDEVVDLEKIPEAELLVAELTERAPKEFPAMPSPLEEIKAAFGDENVADLSGQVDADIRKKYMDDFQNGVRKIAIMSPASSTGINLHHVTWIEKAPGRGRRAIIMMDYKWNAEDFKQGVLGRADRSGQLSTPKIFMQTLGMAAERKFISTLANRLKDVGAIAKGAAESVGAQALLEFEVGGNIDLLAMRDAWSRDYITENDKDWFRGNKFIQAVRIGDQVILRPLGDIRTARLKDFFLQVQLMPKAVGNRAVEAFFRRREELMTAEAEEENTALETQKGDGKVTRVRQLQPNLQLYEVVDKENHKYGILTGMITDKAALIRPMMPSKGKFTYLTFRGADGEPISGLRVPWEMVPLMVRRLGTKELLKHTPENALEDLRAGDKITLTNGWALYMGRAGSRQGKIVIEGAGMLNTERGTKVIPHGGVYHRSGQFFFVKEDRLGDFFKRFPISAELSEEAAGPGGLDDPAYERIWPNEPDAAEIKRRMPETKSLAPQEALAAWRRAATHWFKLREAATPAGDPYHIFNEGGILPREQVEAIAKDPNWGEVGDQIRYVAHEIARQGLPEGYSLSRTGIVFPEPSGAITLGVSLVDPVRANATGAFTNPLGPLELFESLPGSYAVKDARQAARMMVRNLIHEVVGHAIQRGHERGFYDRVNDFEEKAVERGDFAAWVDALAKAVSGGMGNEPGQFLHETLRAYREAGGQRAGPGGPGDRLLPREVGLPSGPALERAVGGGGAPPAGGGGGARPPVPGGPPTPAPEPSAGAGAERPLDVKGFVARLYDVNVKRHLLSAGKTLAELAYDISSLFAPRYFAPEKAVKTIMEMKGWTDEVVQRLLLVDEGLVDMFDKMPREAEIAFWDRYRRGVDQASPELTEVAKFIQRISDQAYKTVIWEQIQDVRDLSPKQKKETYEWAIANLRSIAPLLYGEIEPRSPLERVMVKRLQDEITPYLENHLRAFWEVIPGSLKEGFGVIGQMMGGRRPMQGSKGWMRQHTLPDLTSGIEDGGKPYTHNPIVALNMDVRDHMRFASARRAWRRLKTDGIFSYYRSSRDVPEDMRYKIDDSISEVYFPSPEGGWVKGGGWYTDRDTARMFNNYLSKDRIREKTWGKALTTIVFASKSWELGFSAFHAIFETGMVMGGQAGIGLSQIFNRGIGKGDIKALAKGLSLIAIMPAAPVRYLSEGTKLVRYVKQHDPIIKLFKKDATVEHDPVTEQWLSILFREGGGQLKMHEDYRITAYRGLKDALQENDYVAAILHAFPALMQTMVAPMFDVLIPRYKLGYARELFLTRMVELENELREGKVTRAQIARQTWDQVENMLGEMNFDNLFWNRTFKTILQLLFRSVTWWGGSIRTAWWSGSGQTREIGKIVERRKVSLPSSTTDDPLATARQYRTEYKFHMPKIDPNMAAHLGMVFAAGYISMLFMLLWRKKIPEDVDWKDIVAPRTGKLDERGKEERVRFPHEYWVMMGLLKHPVEAAKGATTGMWTRVLEAIRNRDFYGNYVYSPDDPIVRQWIDVLGHLPGPPIAYAVMQQAKERDLGRGEQALAFLGFRRVPIDFDLEPDEKLALEFLKERGAPEPKTKEEQEVRKNVRKALRGYRGEDIGRDELIKMVREGLIDRGSERRIIRSGRKAWIFRLFLALHPDEKIAVYKAASPDHKAELRKALRLSRRDYLSYTKPQLKGWKEEMEALRTGTPAEAGEPTPAPVPTAPSLYERPRPAPPPE